MYKSLLLLFFLSAGNLLCVAQTTKSDPQRNQPSTEQIKPSSSDSSPTAQDFYKEGLRLTDEGQLSEAVEQLQQAVQIDPQFAEAHAALGRAYFKLRQWQNAVNSLHRASALKSTQRALKEASQTTQQLDSQNSVTKAMPLKPRQPSTLPQSGPGKDGSRRLRSIVPTIETEQPVSINTNFVAAKPASPPPDQTREEEKTLTPPSIPSSTPTQNSTLQTVSNQTVSRTDQDNLAPVTSAEATVSVPRQETEVTPPSEPPASLTRPSSTSAVNVESPKEATAVRLAMSVIPASTPLETKAVAPIPVRTSSDEMALTKIYRIGPGDVLDVQIDDSEPTRSTLFTVTPAGLLEHPRLPEPLVVTGLTTDEISTKVEAGLTKDASGQNSKVIVGVRDYASHSILVRGLVKESGTKFLRREAIPLYVVVADAQPSPQAGRVTVTRNEAGQIFDIDLTEAAEMNMMIRPGDVITLQPNVTQFYYIGGDVQFPGEKTFRRGLTLTQAIITAGGANRKSKFAQIARDDGQGFLVDTKFDLNEIQFGKAVDPILNPGDRITIVR
jgi:protein involved in polysaccharide export with SLBB domain